MTVMATNSFGRVVLVAFIMISGLRTRSWPIRISEEAAVIFEPETTAMMVTGITVHCTMFIGLAMPVRQPGQDGGRLIW